MSGQWKPGDVAMVGHRLYDESSDLTHEVRILRSDGNWHGANGWVANIPEAASSIRPLLVIDPEDMGDVERVRDALWRGGTVEMWQVALRSMLTSPRKSVVTADMVSAMREQVRLDREQSAYWTEGHPDILAGAEAWLDSLADWIGDES